MNIRPAETKDCPAIARIQINSYRTAYAGLMPAEYLAAFSFEEQAQDWLDLLQTSPDLLLVAENEEGRVVGYSLARQTERAETGYDCELVSLHVERSQHRRGFGRALVSEAARRMKAKGCRSLYLWVLDGNPACKFYERLGGVEYGEQFHEIEEFSHRFREIGYAWQNIEDLL